MEEGEQKKQRDDHVVVVVVAVPVDLAPLFVIAVAALAVMWIMAQ